MDVSSLAGFNVVNPAVICGSFPNELDENKWGGALQLHADK